MLAEIYGSGVAGSGNTFAGVGLRVVLADSKGRFSTDRRWSAACRERVCAAGDATAVEFAFGLGVPEESDGWSIPLKHFIALTTSEGMFTPLTPGQTILLHGFVSLTVTGGHYGTPT
ncbi:hypothetical protein PMIN04_005000 [Paraphaeosphaeria minitans]